MRRAFGLCLCLLACEDPPRAAAPPDASLAPPPPPPPREGCTRTGVIEGIDSDPSCVVHRASEDAMRAALKHLSITLTPPESGEAFAGSSVLLTLEIKNTSSVETTVYFEARPRLGGPRTDWSRVVGIPEPHPTAGETPRLLFPMTTTDNHDRDVDAVPTVAGSTAAPPTPTLLAVHLRPGGKLMHKLPWWALRIPAPAPVVTDDAGHRYVPKTIAYPLFPGDYNVIVDLPLHGLSREERKITTRIKVTRPPLLDGGKRPAFY